MNIEDIDILIEQQERQQFLVDRNYHLHDFTIVGNV
jgi:hypothetical protein